MKYRLLIILLLLSSAAFAQNNPYVERIHLDGDGFAFETHTFETIQHTPFPDEKHEYDGYKTVKFASNIDSAFGSTDSVLTTFVYTKFLPAGSVGGYDITEKFKVELSVDSIRSMFTVLKYTYSHEIKQNPYVYNADHYSFSFEFRNISYQIKGDTIFFTLDSTLLKEATITSNYKAGSSTRFTYSSTGTKQWGIGSKAYLSGSFVKLNTKISSITPKIYSTSISPDFTKGNYERDSIALTYRNDLSDTVTITNVHYYDALSNHVQVTYSDGSPLTKSQIILPFERKHQLYFKFMSNEGPYTSYSSSRSATLIIDKLIRGVLYHDTLGLGLTLKGFNFETQITTDKQYNLIEIECKPGDTVLTKIHVLYTDLINNIVFDPIPDSTGFKLVNVIHNTNDKEVEIRFIANEEGIHDYWHPIQYAIRNFDGTLGQYTSEQFIKLHAYVVASNAVTSDMHSNECSVYPNPSSSVVTISLVSQKRQPYSLSIFDELGREVRRVYDGFLDAGEHEFSAELPTGMYYVRMQAGDEVLTRKVTVVR